MAGKKLPEKKKAARLPARVEIAARSTIKGKKSRAGNKKSAHTKLGGKVTENREPKKTGRPEDYRPEFDDLIVQMGSEGASIVEFCAEVGCDRDTPQEWCKKHPSFSLSFRRAKLACQAWWERQARLNTQDSFADGAGSKFNDRLWRVNVACRFRDDWTEKKDDGSAEAVKRFAEIAAVLLQNKK